MRTGKGVLRLEAAIIIILALATAAGCFEPGVKTPDVLPTSSQIPPGPPAPPVHRLPLYYSSLYTMQKNLAPATTLSLPTELPEGFFFVSGTQVEASGEDPLDEGYYSFGYQRGQNEQIYLREQSRNSTSCPDEPVYQTAAAGKTLTQKEGAGELRWGSNGWCHTLSGILSREELEKIAASVRPVPWREGVMPPFEYQPPAHPLVCTLAVNRSSTTKGVTVTVESLQCTTAACTAKIRVGAGPQPSISPPPVVTTMPPVGYSPRAEWQVDGGRPLLTMPGGGMMYNSTSITWKIEPLPEGSRELMVNFSRVNGISGPWQIAIPLNDHQDSGEAATRQGAPS